MSEKAKNITVVLLFCGFLGVMLLCGIISPDKDISMSERRQLAKMPKLSSEAVLNGEFMSGFEDYSVDQFPLRDSFRRLKAATAFYFLRQKDTNGIFLAGSQASRLEYPIKESSAEYAIGRIQNIYNSYIKDTDAKAYICVIPDKNLYIAEKNGYPSIDYSEFEDMITAPISDFAEKISIFDLLDENDYYATDIHWRQERLNDVAGRIAKGMGTDYQGEFEEVMLDVPFYGVYYGQSALPLKADKISYLTNPAIETAKAFDHESGTALPIPIYSMELANGRDPYEMYLCGSKSLLTIENPDALTDKELIIFRDSFGSSLAPLLVESYKKITLVDIRYLQSSFVGRFVEFNNQDVLFLYSVPVLNNSETMK